MVVGGVLFLTPLHHPWNWPLLVSLCLQGYSCANIAAASLHAGPAQETSSTGKRFNGGGTADTQHGSAAAHDVRVPFKLVVMMEWIGRCGYFALGNSNSIATINVSRAACLNVSPLGMRRWATACWRRDAPPSAKRVCMAHTDTSARAGEQGFHGPV